MSKLDLILVGAGGHAGSCIDVIQEEGKYRIAGLVGLKSQVGTKHFGVEVIGSDEELDGLANQYQYALVATGQIKTAEKRVQLFRLLKEKGFTLPSIIAPTAHVSLHSKIGEGTIVMHGAIVNFGASVGSNCIINSNALIEHDTQVGDHCHISTGSILNGNISIGKGSFVGSGAIIKEGMTVGAGSIIGMGLVVRHNLIENSNFTGGLIS
jgi:sugar O-acyltransferase (sialic acid O-acetyltransferase NeuD family)